MPRRLCLAIGVANAKPLEWLPGAANAAADMGNWARCSDFDAVTVLTDEPSVGQTRWTKGDAAPQNIHSNDITVTISRIAEEIAQLLPQGIETDWFVLHFAGHGLRQDITRSMWLPSDWSVSNRAIAVETLRQSLETYGIDHLTIISDACRDFANREDTSNLIADGVIGKGSVNRRALGLDRINAVRDGASAFMVPGNTQQDARCILTGTMLNTIWGHEQNAFHVYDKDKIISESLLGFIETATEKRGAEYGLASRAEALRSYGNTPKGMVYFDRDQPPKPPTEKMAWPPSKPVAVPTITSISAPPLADTPSEAAVEEALKRIEVIAPSAVKTDIGNAQIIDQISVLESIKGGADLAMAIDRASETGLTSQRQRLRNWRAEVKLDRVIQENERSDASTTQSAIRSALREGQRRESGSANLSLRGGNPVRIWSPMRASRLGRMKSWNVGVDDGRAVQIIVEYNDGLFAPMVVYASLDTVAVHDGQGRITGWMCVPRHSAGTQNLSATTDIIARMQTNRMSPAEIDKLASSIRHEKHVNPMLGAIAAYLYDYVGDRDNIRRMAWFYASQGQPIPFDIVFMGLIETRSDSKGALIAHIPAVSASEHFPDSHSRPEFAIRATPSITGIVAGRCPWLRQGWDFVAAPEPTEQAMADPLQGAQAHVLDSSFSALSREGAEMLIAEWKLEADK